MSSALNPRRLNNAIRVWHERPVPKQIRLWRVHSNDQLTELLNSALDAEARLEEWIDRDVNVLSTQVLLIGRQIPTGYGGFIDLLAIDRSGDLVVIELKRNKTPREIVAQALDYASWVTDLSHEQVLSIASSRFGGPADFEKAFQERFGEELPDMLNGSHSILIVGSEIDPSSERIIRYLSDTHGVTINAATFQVFRGDGEDQFLGRVFLLEPEEVESRHRQRGTGKRRPRLTPEELDAQAEENGVAPLYRAMTPRLEQLFIAHGRTRSGVRYWGTRGEGKQVIFALFPGRSSTTRGLHFQVYFRRFVTYFRLADDEALALLPKDRSDWKYYAAADEDYSGYEGFFSSASEVERFLHGLEASPTRQNAKRALPGA